MKWHRIVLDEAHTIRNRSTAISRSCCALQGVHRWAMTGTPIVNSAEDVFSLFKFLWFRPFCDIRFFNSRILSRIQKVRRRPDEDQAPRRGPSAASQRKGVRELQVALAAVTMRRRKDSTFGGAPIVSLPPRTVNVVQIPFATPEERSFYDSIEQKSQDRFEEYARRGFAVNYANILVLLTRLRQAAVHPHLAQSAVQQLLNGVKVTADEAADGVEAEDTPEKLTEETKAELLAKLIAPDAGECCICMEIPVLPRITLCGHGPFCKECILRVLENQDQETRCGKCPLCRKGLTPGQLYSEDDVRPPWWQQLRAKAAALEASKAAVLAAAGGGGGNADEEGGEEDDEAPWVASTKLSATVEQLKAFQAADEEANCSRPAGAPAQATKSVDFSLFYKALALLGRPLEEAGIRYAVLDGKMTMMQRAAVVQDFVRDPSLTVMLCTTCSAGQGLNLTVACRVILLDV